MDKSGVEPSDSLSLPGSERDGFRVRFTFELGTRLFSADAIRAWERAGGAAFLRRCRDRLQRQGSLVLRPGRKPSQPCAKGEEAP